MSISLATAALVGAGINAATSIGGAIQNQYNADKTRQFNREEAEKNRTFQREMAQNNIKYAVQQANELGISPSLVLGDQTKQLGGSQASVGNPPASNSLSGIGQIANILESQYNIQKQLEMNEDKLNTMEKMNEDKLHTMEKIAQMKMSNSTTNATNDYIKRHGYNNREEFNKSIFDNLDNIEL